MNFPLKQKVPLLLLCALCFWATCALTYWYGRLLINHEIILNNYFYIICFILITLILSIILLIKYKKSCFVIISVIVLGIFISYLYAYSNNNKMNTVKSIEAGKYIFESLEDQKNGSTYNSFISKFNYNNTEYKIKINIQNNIQEEIHAGDTFEIDANFADIQEAQYDNFWQNGLNGNAWGNNLKIKERKDIFGAIYSFRNCLIKTIRNYDWEDRSYGEQLLNAIVCGQRIDLNSGDLYDSFKNCGLAHLVAVSGAHLSLVSALLIIFLKKLKFKKWLIIVIQSVFIICYLICTAIPISALRAALMTSISIYSFFAKRRPAPLNAIAICIFIIIGFNPQSSISISFVLSASSTIGIIIFSRLFEYLIYSITSKLPAFINNALALTLSSGICSQPISISIFNQIPLISPFANIIAAPIFSILCAAGLISSVFSAIFNKMFPFLSSVLMNITYMLSQILCWISQALCKIPYACIPANLNIYIAILITLILCTGLYLYWDKFKNINKKLSLRKNKKFASIACMCTLTLITICIIIPKNSSTELVMLDVGQGDSIYLESKGKNFLIDTGNQDNKLKENFAKMGITHLDGILITHPDDDHCGSLDMIENLIDVSKIYVAKDLLLSSDKNCIKLVNQINQIVDRNSIIELNVGDHISFGEIVMDVVWPDEYKDNGGNCDSLCLIANIDIDCDGDIEARALLCGDAEKEEISQMLIKNRIPDIDIYKCGHHGSKNAIYEKDIQIIRPKITLISVGEKNRYGHPSQSTLSLLEKTNSKIYRTDKSGNIFCYFNYGQIDIKTENS